MEATIMDYESHYNRLCERARNRSLTTYTEKHHVTPQCLGGTNNKSNLVDLTPEEHYVTHQLLVKMYPNNYKLKSALFKMTHGRSNNRAYGWIKREYQKVAQQRVGSNNPSYGKSWYYDPETLENGKFSPENAPEGWIKGRKKQKYTKQEIIRARRKLQSENKTKEKIEYFFPLYVEWVGGESLRNLSKKTEKTHVSLYKFFENHKKEFQELYKCRVL